MKINLQSGTILTAYFLTCGILYLWGFWLHFDLNILQFVDVSDIIKATILPMITSLCIWVLNSIINTINNPASASSRELWKAGGRYRLTVYLQWTFLAIIIIAALHNFVNIFLNSTKAEKYFVMGFFLFGSVYFWVSFKTEILIEYKKQRPLLLAIIIGMPLIFMQRGIQDAKDILKGDNTFLVESNNLCNSKQNSEKFRYIGTLSDKGFAYSLNNNSLCIFKYDYIKLIKEKSINASKYNWLDKINVKIERLFN